MHRSLCIISAFAGILAVTSAGPVAAPVPYFCPGAPVQCESSPHENVMKASQPSWHYTIVTKNTPEPHNSHDGCLHPLLHIPTYVYATHRFLQHRRIFTNGRLQPAVLRS